MKEIRDFFNKITPQQKMILVISLCIILSIGVGCIFYFYLYTPKLQELTQLKEELKTKKDELESMQFLATQLAAAEKARDQKIRELRTLEKGLPEEEYVPTLLTEIENLGEEIKAKISSITLSEPTQVQQQPNQQFSLNYKEMTLGIPFQGTYEVLKEFLNRLGNFPMVVVVNSMQISRSGEKDPYDGTPILSANLPAVVYILPKEGGEKKSEESKS
jgi:Tfp pilus assembly protein PilO